MSGTSFSFPFNTPFGSGFSFVPAPIGTPLSSLSVNPPNASSNGIDRLIDPFTLDYVRTDDGQWAETADNRTTVLIAMSIPLGASPFDPEQGTSIAARIRSGAGLSPEFLRAESERVGAQLARDGVLSELQITVRDGEDQPLRDQAGRLVVRWAWRDLSSGSPATTTFATR